MRIFIASCVFVPMLSIAIAIAGVETDSVSVEGASFARTDAYNFFSTSNRFDGAFYADNDGNPGTVTKMMDLTAGKFYTENEFGPNKWSIDFLNAQLATDDHVSLDWAQGILHPTPWNGVWRAPGTATQGDEIVNYQTVLDILRGPIKGADGYKRVNLTEGKFYHEQEFGADAVSINWLLQSLYNGNGDVSVNWEMGQLAGREWTVDNTADNGLEIVNFQTMAAYVAAHGGANPDCALKSGDNVFTGNNRFTQPVVLGTTDGGTTFESDGVGSLFVKDYEGNTMLYMGGPITGSKQSFSVYGVEVLEMADWGNTLKDDGITPETGGIWKSEGTATNGLQIVNFQTMATYVAAHGGADPDCALKSAYNVFITSNRFNSTVCLGLFSDDVRPPPIGGAHPNLIYVDEYGVVQQMANPNSSLQPSPYDEVVLSTVTTTNNLHLRGLDLSSVYSGLIPFDPRYYDSHPIVQKATTVDGTITTFGVETLTLNMTNGYKWVVRDISGENLFQVGSDGVGHVSGTAISGDDIVNFETMAAQNYAKKDADNTFTGNNTFSKPITIGGSPEANGELVFGGGIRMQASPEGIYVFYNETPGGMDISRMQISTNAASTALMDEWLYVGPSTSGKHIVNFETMDSFVEEATTLSMDDAAGTNCEFTEWKVGGNANQDGNWRMGVVGSNLTVQVRVSGSWVNAAAFTRP